MKKSVKKHKYEDRIVVFVDILGFKDIITTTTSKNSKYAQSQIDLIIKAFDIISDVWGADETYEKHPDLKAAYEENKVKSKKITTFSDSIVISFLQNEPSEIFYTLLELQWLIMKLVNQGILCRGALSYGKMIHNDKFLFGPALVDAYLIETKAALYPRIIVSQELIKMAGKYPSRNHDSEMEIKHVLELLKEDTDGMFYIDYFLAAQSELDDPENDFPQYINNLSDVIRKGVRSIRPDVKIKYMWMRDKINKIIVSGKQQQWLDQLKSKGKYDLADAYQSLKEV